MMNSQTRGRREVHMPRPYIADLDFEPRRKTQSLQERGPMLGGQTGAGGERMLLGWKGRKWSDVRGKGGRGLRNGRHLETDWFESHQPRQLGGESISESSRQFSPPR